MHRDIKPGNIKITPEGDVTLVDFGLVKFFHDQEMTTTAARAMTPGYSPPEQYGETPTDHRSDIYSLGATLYTALAGYLPEDSLSRTTGSKQLTPLRHYAPHVSTQTASVIEKALELRFEDRWQSAEDLRNALADSWQNLPADDKATPLLMPARRSKKTEQDQPGIQKITETTRDKLYHSTKDGHKKIDSIWLTIGILTILMILFLATSLFLFNGLQWDIFQPARGEQTPVTLAAYPTATGAPLSATLTPAIPIAAAETLPAGTPTGGGGGMLAYVSERTGEPQIWLVDVETLRTNQVTFLNDGACQPDWNPEGSQIVFTTPCPSKRTRYPGSRLMIIDIDTSVVTPLPASLEGDFDPAWSPDGQSIVYTTLVNGQMQLAKITLEDRTITRLSDGSFDDSSPAWSPKGDKLVFARIRGVSQIWIMDADGDNAVQFTRSGIIDNSNPAWFPDENLILFSQALGLESPNKQLFGMRLEDLGKEEEYRILPRARLDYTPLMDHVDVSPDGHWLAFDFWFADVLSDIYIMVFPGANLTQITDHPAMDYQPAWRPIP